jgi:hypothetical protein
VNIEKEKGEMYIVLSAYENKMRGTNHVLYKMPRKEKPEKVRAFPHPALNSSFAK